MSHENRQLSGYTDSTAPLHSKLLTWLTTQSERAGNALVYSSAYLAVIAMAEVAIAMTLLSLPMSLAPIVVGLVTFAVYTNDRLADVDTDAISNPKQAAFVRRHQDLLYVLAALAYGFAVALSVLGGPIALAITLLPGAFWVVYASDWIPEIGLQFQRLKDVLIVNSAVVALAWAITLTFLPLAFAGATATPTVAVVFAYFFLRSFVDTEIPNIRDIEGDRAIDVATMPVVFGVRRTRQVLYGIDLATAALLGYAALDGHLSLVLAVGLGIGLLYSFGVTTLIGRAGDDLLAIAPECEYVFVGLALVLIVGL